MGAQDQGIFPKRQSFPHDQGYKKMTLLLDNVEETLVLVPRPSVMTSLSSSDVKDGCFSRGLGSGPGGPLTPGSVEVRFLALKTFLPDLRSYPLYKLSQQILQWAQGKLLSLRAAYFTGHLNQAADVLSRQGLRPGEWRLYPEVVGVEEVRASGRGHISVSRNDTLSALVLSDSSSPTGVECHGTDMANAMPVCISPFRSAPGNFAGRVPI